MSNDVVKNGQKYMAKSSNQSFRKDVAEFVLTTGAGGLGLWIAAGLLPFITLPMLLIAAVLLGGYLYVK